MERGLIRLLDANANRASEGLRVLEDLARFTLNDEQLAREFKTLRHDLAGEVGSILPDRAQRLACRDTPGDVGTRLSTPAEHERKGLGAVAAAASGRVAEALRVLEETVKTIGSAGFEPLRYRVYELSRRLELALCGRRARQWKLCVLITRALCEDHPWQRVAELAIEGGADCLQLREKSMGTGELVAAAKELVAIASGKGVSVIVNDRTDVALAAGADGVHVGQSDMAVRDVRALAGSSLLVGVSCSTIAQACHAALDGVDSIGLGPMFASSTKPKDTLAGPALVQAVLAEPMLEGMPHLAISGIGPSNVGELAQIGCRGVAVSSAVCGSEDPAGACRAILGGLGS